MSTEAAPRTRDGGRAARRAIRTAPNFEMLPGLRHQLPICEVMDGTQVERIDAASMDILENVGIHFRDPIAIEDWKGAGAKVDGELIYLDRGLVRELIATIPSEFTYHARDPRKNVKLGGRHAVFAPMAGTPEICLMNFMIGQMARHYDVPWRTSNTLGGAKTFDAQAGYESATALSSVIHSGANYIWHSAGWNEAGMHCSVATTKSFLDIQISYPLTEPRRLACNDQCVAKRKVSQKLR